MWAWDDVDVQAVRRRAGLVEQRTYDPEDDPDTNRDIPNPIYNVPVHRLNDHFERAEALDKALVRIGLGGKDPEGGAEYVKGLTLGRRKFSQLARLPIAGLLSTEPKLESAHIDALLKGTATQESSDLPIIFRLQDGDWIVDGNHRVAAEKMKGADEVAVELLDLRQLETELFS